MPVFVLAVEWESLFLFGGVHNILDKMRLLSKHPMNQLNKWAMPLPPPRAGFDRKVDTHHSFLKKTPPLHPQGGGRTNPLPFLFLNSKMQESFVCAMTLECVFCVCFLPKMILYYFGMHLCSRNVFSQFISFGLEIQSIFFFEKEPSSRSNKIFFGSS